MVIVPYTVSGCVFGPKGANMIMGAVIFNGVACGMIYRPIEATRRKVDAVHASDRGRGEANVPRSAIFRRIVEEKRRRRTTSTGSLDGTVITKDNRVVRAELASDSVANSLHVIHEQSSEDDPHANANEVSVCTHSIRSADDDVILLTYTLELAIEPV